MYKINYSNIACISEAITDRISESNTSVDQYADSISLCTQSLASSKVRAFVAVVDESECQGRVHSDVLVNAQTSPTPKRSQHLTRNAKIAHRLSRAGSNLALRIHFRASFSLITASGLLPSKKSCAAMATGSDVLLEHLLFQVALSGNIGTSFLRVALLWSHVFFPLVESEMIYSIIMHEVEFMSRFRCTTP